MLASETFIPTMSINNLDVFYEGLGNLIKDARKSVDMSQHDLAFQLGLKRTSIANIERGKQRPPVHVILLVAKILNVEFNYLLSNAQKYDGSKRYEDSSTSIVWDKVVTQSPLKSLDKKELTNFINNL